ncbi:hypothetical protein [Pseudomonas gozinkensis]|uniref:hypothetical protein n=1 Tax=Pseudomonas gozinkensis TaxID=2774461 RepID=UPI0017880EC3|nr:hypothetical protein [Pseudomonas gozinkensis]
MSVSGPLNFKPPQVIGVLDHSQDPEGHVPSELLPQGLDVVVPLWPSYATQPGDRDKLVVRYEQVGQIPVVIINEYLPADIKPEFVIHIEPKYLLSDGVGKLWYEVYDTADHPSFSDHRNLTIDHSPVRDDLEMVTFRDADPWGTVHCFTEPAIWTGIWLVIPALTGSKVGDRCEVTWRGYGPSSSGSVEIPRTRWENIRQSLSDQDVKTGYSLTVNPYVPHIEPMVANASATVIYRIFRGARLVGMSKVATLKISRMLAGDPVPCGP